MGDMVAVITCPKCKKELGQTRTVKGLSYLQVKGGWYIREGFCECWHCKRVFFWYGTTHDRTRFEEYARREKEMLDMIASTLRT